MGGRPSCVLRWCQSLGHGCSPRTPVLRPCSASRSLLRNKLSEPTHGRGRTPRILPQRLSQLGSLKEWHPCETATVDLHIVDRIMCMKEGHLKRCLCIALLAKVQHRVVSSEQSCGY